MAIWCVCGVFTQKKTIETRFGALIESHWNAKYNDICILTYVDLPHLMKLAENCDTGPDHSLQYRVSHMSHLVDWIINPNKCSNASSCVINGIIEFNMVQFDTTIGEKQNSLIKVSQLCNIHAYQICCFKKILVALKL